mgnify:CR=1 FL=1
MPTFFRCCLLLTPLCFSACTIHKVGDETAVTLDTGNEVVDAASYVVAGAKLQKKLQAEQRQTDAFNKKDPVVKQMNEAIEKAKDRKHGLEPTKTDSAADASSLVIKKSGGGW